MAKVDNHRLNKVLKFWTRMNPDTLFKELSIEEYERLDNSIRRLRILWNQMKARCYNPNAQDYHNYGE